jgi:hypothetical protein
LASHEDVLDGIIKAVPHVEDAGDIGRRDDHGEGFTVIGCAVKIARGVPMGIPFFGGAFEIEILAQFHAGDIGLGGKGKHSRARGDGLPTYNPAEKI